MKRKQPDDVRSPAPCEEEWLTTRNKQKIKPVSPKPRRRHSSVVRGFPRQSKSSLWQLTQTTPPHPLLFTATKQTTIQGFFPTNNNSDKQPNNGSITETQASEPSSPGGGSILDSHIEFDPLISSTNVCISSHDKNTSDQSHGSIARKQEAREATLVGMCYSHEAVPVKVVDCLSDIDFPQRKIAVSAIRSSDLSTPDILGNLSSNSSILPSDDPRASRDGENGQKDRNESEAIHATSKTMCGDALFTEDVSDSLPLIVNQNTMTFKLWESEKQEEKNVCEDAVSFVDNSLTFTQTNHSDTHLWKSRPRLCVADSLDTDYEMSPLPKHKHWVSEDVLTKHDAGPCDEMFQKRLRRQPRAKSVAGRLDGNFIAWCLEPENEECKTSPSVSVPSGDDSETQDVRCLLEHGRNGLKPTSLQGRSRQSLNDHYLATKHTALKQDLSDCANSLDLSPPAPSSGKGATGPVRPLRPFYISKSGQNDSDTDKRAHGNDLFRATRARACCAGSITGLPSDSQARLCKTSRSSRHQSRESGSASEDKYHLRSEGILKAPLSNSRTSGCYEDSNVYIDVEASERCVADDADSLVFTPSQGPNTGADEGDDDIDAGFFLDSQLM
ncbi:uncharacterized protein LOC124114443 [Haliotis rufescens]|uniref:uncharacterized protein LOC124114443 n=1 Tax=Haliotis rufescens TaxID=6454 RepID=UPI00201F5EEA|nr:uncharacterized protein LOC124114443 [Haliotis rufescens]